MPAALTATRTSPGPGVGSGRSPRRGLGESRSAGRMDRTGESYLRFERIAREALTTPPEPELRLPRRSLRGTCPSPGAFADSWRRLLAGVDGHVPYDVKRQGK